VRAGDDWWCTAGGAAAGVWVIEGAGGSWRTVVSRGAPEPCASSSASEGCDQADGGARAVKWRHGRWVVVAVHLWSESRGRLVVTGRRRCGR
jgi:hypothetical protein